MVVIDAATDPAIFQSLSVWGVAPRRRRSCIASRAAAHRESGADHAADEERLEHPLSPERPSVESATAVSYQRRERHPRDRRDRDHRDRPGGHRGERNETSSVSAVATMASGVARGRHARTEKRK